MLRAALQDTGWEGILSSKNTEQKSQCFRSTECEYILMGNMLKKFFVAYVKKALRIGKTFENIRKMKEHIHHLNVIKNITKYVKK